MKLTLIIAAVLLLYLFARIWFGQGSHSDIHQLQQQITQQQKDNKSQEATNQQLQVEVDQLKSEDEAIEAYARSELGMIKKGETFYQIILHQPNAENNDNGPADGQNEQARTQSFTPTQAQSNQTVIRQRENAQEANPELPYAPTYIPRKELSND
ncbi:MAG: FtsB family cell division protein [bacterium]